MCFVQRKAFCAIVAALVTSLGLAAQKQQAATGPFNKIWTVALSQYNQSNEAGISLTQLSNGTIVVGGNDANQQNYCSTHRQPFYGGAWLVAVTPVAATTCGRNCIQRALAQPSRPALSRTRRTED